MAFLDEFTANFNKYSGPAYLNRFEVVIIAPFEANPDIGRDRFTSFKVISASMPGKNIRTSPNENVYGPTYEMAQGLTYAETVSFDFYLSAEHVERTYFLNWMDIIVDPTSYNLEYYDNYKRDIEIYQLDKGERRTAGLKLTECYPKTLGAVEYSQDATDVGRINVEFVFKEHFHIDGVGQPVNDAYRPESSTQRQPSRQTAVSGNASLDQFGIFVDRARNIFRL